MIWCELVGDKQIDRWLLGVVHDIVTGYKVPYMRGFIPLLFLVFSSLAPDLSLSSLLLSVQPSRSLFWNRDMMKSFTSLVVVLCVLLHHASAHCK